MSHLATDVDRIKLRVRNGYPNGVDEESHRDLPILLDYIDRLEHAVALLSRTANLPGNEYREIVEIYRKDALNALDLIRRDTGPRTSEIWYPAE